MYYTTLRAMREHNPYSGFWKNLLDSLGKTEADDEPLSIATILEAHGTYNAIWALRAIEGIDNLCRLFAVRCFWETPPDLREDKGSLYVLRLIELYAVGEVSRADLVRDAREYASLDVSRIAVCDSSEAACEAACEAAWNAAWNYSRGSVWGTVEDDFKAIFCED